MNKTAIVVLSDPKTGSEEASGRVFNALASAYESKKAEEDVVIIFQGTGSRWPEALQKEDNPVHKLFMSVKDKVKGVSSGCADVFGANTDGFDLINENEVPGTSGFPSFLNLRKDGYTILTF